MSSMPLDILNSLEASLQPLLCDLGEQGAGVKDLKRLGFTCLDIGKKEKMVCLISSGCYNEILWASWLVNN
jgi:hypothetical protein